MAEQIEVTEHRKLMFEFFKHLSILTTASAAVLASLIGRGVLNLDDEAISDAFKLYFGALLACLGGMGVLAWVKDLKGCTADTFLGGCLAVSVTCFFFGTNESYKAIVVNPAYEKKVRYDADIKKEVEAIFSGRKLDEADRVKKESD
jgi:hypothetical protein